MTDVSSALRGYLKSWYETTTENKRKQDVVVELTFDQFVGLFQKRQLASLQKSIDTNRLRYMQDDKNAFAYVATWKSYAARSTNVWSAETALICSRSKSSTVNLPQAGDKLRPLHRERISKSLTGVAKSPDHRMAISQASKGVAKEPWSDERRMRKSIQRKAQEAAKRLV